MSLCSTGAGGRAWPHPERSLPQFGRRGAATRHWSRRPASVGSRQIYGHDIDDETLPDYVATTLNAHQVDPNYLTLEITESVLASDPDRAERTVRQLQRVGVRVSIDDFGIGYSSMSQLLDLPFDELKVDRSFIAAGGNNDKARAILNATVELGRALGVSVVAEGVEDNDSMILVTESHAAKPPSAD